MPMQIASHARRSRWPGIRVATIAVGLCASVVVWVPSAHSFELFGRCLFGTCELDAGDSEIAFIDPRTYDLDFTVEEGADDDSAENAVKGASDLWNGRDGPVGGGAGLIARAKGDYKRILAALYNRGYYGPLISIELNGTQASDIRPGTEVPQNSSVTVRVTPGERYRFGTTDIVNAAPPTQDPDDQIDGPESVGFETGEVAEATAVRAAGRLAVRAWRQQGYAKAAVGVRDANAVHPDDQLNVTIRMEPGRKAAYGEITVEGTEYMNPAFVAYMTGLTPGEEYDPDTLARARKRIERLGVFTLQRFQEAETIGNDGLLPINVLVKERKLRRIGAGATYSSIDGAGAEAFWLHRNLFGQAESLRLSAEVGGVGGGAQVDAVEELDYEIAATFKKPGLLDPDTDFIANAFARSVFNDTFSEKSVGASAGLTRYQTENITLSAEGFVKYGEYEDVFGTRRFGIVGAQATGEYDLRDDELDPTEGLYFSTLARPFYEWEFGNAASRFEAEARGYLSPGDEGRSVFAARVKVGTLLGPSIEETPPDQLFLAGGGGSVRGYGFKNIGIRQANGDVTGGQSLVEGSLEFRQRFGRSFGAVAFADIGMVGEESFSGFDTDPKVGVGVGFRYYSGLGPIRLDVAIPLNADDGDPDFAFYAGIGHAF